MTHHLLELYQEARENIFAHVGISSVGIFSNFSDNTDDHWFLNGEDDIIYWDANDVVYQATLHRILDNKSYIAIGADLSLVLADFMMGGDLVPMILDNKKQADELPNEIEDQL